MAEAKIFIAEDNQHFCELYRITLRGAGYEVEFATNGKETLEKIASFSPDLIILDVMMPEMDGYEVCRRLRELPQFALTPVILLTALATDDAKIKGYQVGADDYLTKPFPLKVLKARVAAMLERSKVRKIEAPQPQAAEAPPEAGPVAQPEPKPASPPRPLDPSEDALEQICGLAIPRGSNILVLGPLASGKSTFSRLFLAQGLHKGEKCLLVCIDDDPSMVRNELKLKHDLDASACEAQGQMRVVDAYSWSAGRISTSERFAITGTLDLADLSSLVNEAASELGQTDRLKGGGRRVVDSISSLFLNFELSYVQRFIAFVARSGHFSGASTLFIVEEGACDEQALNNIKYIMDGVVEFKSQDQRFLARAQFMKWGAVRPDWTDLTRVA